jgi:hypothetical protein
MRIAFLAASAYLMMGPAFAQNNTSGYVLLPVEELQRLMKFLPARETGEQPPKEGDKTQNNKGGTDETQKDQAKGAPPAPNPREPGPENLSQPSGWEFGCNKIIGPIVDDRGLIRYEGRCYVAVPSGLFVSEPYRPPSSP